MPTEPINVGIQANDLMRKGDERWLAGKLVGRKICKKSGR